MNQDRAVVVSKLRDVYFRRGAGSALVMWVALWALGTLKYGAIGTAFFVLASLGSLWLGAGMLAERLVVTTTPDVESESEEAKKAA
jgi:hypothetical protein